MAVVQRERSDCILVPNKAVTAGTFTEKVPPPA